MTLNDTAVLAGGYHETGSITFTLYLGQHQGRPRRRPRSPATARTPRQQGINAADDRYRDGHLSVGRQLRRRLQGPTLASENNAPAEQVTVAAAGPAISTTPSRATSITLKATSVTCEGYRRSSPGGYHETGTITFTLYLQHCWMRRPRSPATARTPRQPDILPTTGTVTGTYQWDASQATATPTIAQ